jgi:hypothetical protein
MHLGTFAAVVLVVSTSVVSADEITEAIDQARQSYEASDLSGARQSLEIAVQLIGQKKAEKISALLPPALPGWTAAEAQANAIGNLGFGLGLEAASASRTYSNSDHQEVEVSISGDSAALTPLASLFANPALALLANPALAGLSGNKVVRIGKEQGFQDKNGDIFVAVAKYVIVVKGTGPAAAKLAYAQAIDLPKLTKM